jgi:RHS repeat-associated protein
MLEGLYQVATGKGFDGNGDGDTVDSGPAGLASTQTNPGFGGDVPAFNSFLPDPANHVLSPAGILGGVGFRPDALPVILVATDTGTVYQPAPPPAPTTITGAGGVSVPIGKLLDQSRNTTPGGRGAQFQKTIDALTSLGAQVIGLGTNGDPNFAPRQTLEAVARLTGAVNKTAGPIDSQIPGDPIDPGDPLYFQINNNSGPSTAQGVTAAISAAVRSARRDVDAVAAPAYSGFVNLTGVVPGVAGGEHAVFNIRLTGDGVAHSFDLKFLQAGTGNQLGSIPVVIDYPYDSPVLAIDPDGDVVSYRLVQAPADASINHDTGIITWQPTAAGSCVFKVEASDGRGGFDYQTYTVIVTQGAPDGAPHFTSTPPTSATAGVALAYQATADDPDGDGLSFYLDSGPFGMTIDRVSGLVSWAPSAADVGDKTVVLEVLDGRGKNDTQTFTLHVNPFSYNNADPVLAVDHPPTATVGLLYEAQASATDANNDPLTFDLPVHPAGTGIDSQGGAIRWQPTLDEVGTQHVLVRVRDGRGGVALESFDVVVSAPNHAPEFVSGPPADALVGRAYRHQAFAIDPDPGDTVSYSLVGAPTGMQIGAQTGVLVWTPTVDGDFAFTIVATDNHGAATDQPVTLHVVVPQPPDHPPQITSTPPGTLVLSQLYTYPVIAEDPDNDPLTYTLKPGAPGGMQIGAQSGILTWTPTAYGPGTFTIHVDDGRGGWAEQTVQFDLEPPPPVNHPPQITSQPSAPGAPGSAYTYQVTATDPDAGDTITYSLQPGFPSGMTINPQSGALGWMVGPAGDYPVTVRAADSHGAWAEQSFVLGVTRPNRAPRITSTPVTVAPSNQTYTYQVTATDPDATDEVRFTLRPGAPSGMGIDYVTGLLSWPASPSLPVGSYPITVRADDGHGAWAEQQFTLAVYNGTPPPTNHPPKITSDPPPQVAIGQQYTYQVTASDPDAGDTVTFSLDASPIPPAGMTITSAGLLTWTPSAGGTFEAVVRASDGHGGYATQQLTFNIPSINHPPKITSTPPGASVGVLYDYQVTASDPDAGDTVTFSLDPGAPNGMTITSAGHLTWTPPNAATVTFTVRASDGHGGFGTQRITVTPASGVNRPPEFTSTPPTVTEVNQLFSYQATASDPDAGDTVTFSLDPGAPNGVNVTSAGLVTWTPSVASATPYQFVVRASDQHGASTAQLVKLLVVDNSGSNHAPKITNTPRTSIRAGNPYSWQAEATDEDGDAISFQLSNAPSWLTMTSDGKLASTAGHTVLADVGTYTGITVVAVDSRGAASVPLVFDLEVFSNGANNHKPTITSTAPTAAVVGRQYAYPAAATDPDGDTVFWELISGPDGAVVDHDSGVLVWTPTLEQLGAQDITIRAEDVYGGLDDQAFRVTVRATNSPAEITQLPAVEAIAGQTYESALGAEDPDGDPIHFTKLLGPSGLAIDKTTGVVTWAVPSALAGQTVDVRLAVADSFGEGQQAVFQIQVKAPTGGGGTGNHDPVIHSSAPRQVLEGTQYKYPVDATDQDGDTLSYTVAEGVQGMSFVGSELRWDVPSNIVPTGQDDVKYWVTVLVSDGHNGSARERYQLDVLRENNPPSMDSIPTQTVAQGQPVAYDVHASDPDFGDTLTYSLTGAPNGMTIDPDTGRLRWPTSGVAVGTYTNITVKATDRLGLVASQPLTVVVTADTTDPEVEVEVLTGPVANGHEALIQVRAVDDVGIDHLKLTVDGHEVQLDAYGVGRYTPNLPAGTTYPQFLAVLAEAWDPANNHGSATTALQVYDPTVTNAPVATITDPADQATVTEPVTVKGTAEDNAANSGSNPSLAVNYKVEVFDESGRRVRLLNTPNVAGTDYTHGRVTPTTAGGLGTFDPTLLDNGTYSIVLSVVNGGLTPATASIQVGVTGNLKVGNFHLSFVDLSVPVVGIPITITRAYDTTRAGTAGAFGYGWDLKIGGYTVSVDRSTADPGSNGYLAFRRGTRVAVKRSDGRVDRYTFDPQPGAELGGAVFWYVPYFRPDHGVVNQLITDQSVTLIPTDDQGHFIVEDESGDLDYDPANPAFGGAYEVQEPFGVKYTVDAATGEFRKAKDRNGNALTFTDDGITSNRGQRITFERDQRNRISAIIDTAGKRIEYTYNAKGDLTAVKDRTNRLTHYTYEEPTRPHFLTKVIDTRGVTVAQTQFDPTTGRLVGLVDANGQTASLGYTMEISPGRFLETSGAGGIQTEVLRDGRGNTVRVVRKYVDPQNSQAVTYYINVYEYDGNDNQLRASNTFAVTDPSIRFTYQPNPVPWVEQRTYDANGNMTTITDTAGHTSYYSYDQYGGQLSASDPLGGTSRTQFDADGNVVAKFDNGVQTLSNTLNDFGEVLTSRDTTGAKFAGYGYDDQGRMVSETDRAGTSYTFSHDAAEHPTGMSFVWTDPTGNQQPVTIATNNTFDDEGRPLRSTGPNGQWTQQVYDSDGSLSQTVDSDGHAETTVYNVGGQQVQIRKADGTVQEVVYDDFGRDFITTTPHLPGVPTTAVRKTYDSLGRVYQAESLRNVTVAVTDDPNNSNTEGVPFKISQLQAGYVVVETTRTTFDPATGRPVGSVDADGNQTTYEYDAFGRQSAVVQPGHLDPATGLSVSQRVETEYDAAGRTLLTRDHVWQFSNGTVDRSQARETRYFYDDSGRVTRTVLPDGTTMRTEYDQSGRKVAEYDQLDRVTRYEYDANGRLSAVVQPPVDDPESPGQQVNPRYEYTYDAFGNQQSITTNLAQIGTQVRRDQAHATQFTYNQYRLETSRTLPGGEKEYFTYDTRGRLTRQTRFDGVTFEQVYGDLDRVSQARYFAPGVNPDTGSPAETWGYTYDGAGRATLVDQGGGRTTAFHYDGYGALLDVTTPEGKINYVYDGRSRLQSVWTGTDPAHPGVANAYEYDTFSRIDAVNQTALDGTAIPAAQQDHASYVYDPFTGRVDHVVEPDGAIAAYAYDGMDRVTGVRLLGPDATPNNLNDNPVLESFAYTYYPDGLKQSETLVSPAGTTTTHWTHDNLGRLLQEQRTGPGTTTVTTDYTYDLVGNRLSRVTTTTGAPTDEVHYVYNADDQLTQETAYHGGVPVTRTTYVYNPTDLIRTTVTDLATNQVTEETDYTYAYLGQTSSVTVRKWSGGVLQSRAVTQYAYDSSGNRTRVEYQFEDGAGTVLSHTVTNRVVDAQNPAGFSRVLEEKTYDASASGSPLVSATRYLTGKAVHAQATTTSGGTTKLTLLPDAKGSTRVLANAQGAAVQRLDYDADGNRTDTSGAAPTRLLYDGEEYDPGTGLYYLRARNYDPSNGRFDRLDPASGSVGRPQTLNKYVFGNSDPVDVIDPTGNEGLGGLSVSMSISSSLRSMNIGTVLRIGFNLMVIAREGIAAYNNMLEVAQVQKQHDKATIMVPGVNGPTLFGINGNLNGPLMEMSSPNWFTRFGYPAALQRNGLNTNDLYDFHWSRFDLAGFGVIPNWISHFIAATSLLLTTEEVASRGYNKVNLLGHSWGAMLSYDVLKVSGVPVDNWVTLGSPLHQDTDKPASLRGKWLDVFSQSDPVTWLRIPGGYGLYGAMSLFHPFISLATLPMNAVWGSSAIRTNADILSNATGMAIAAPLAPGDIMVGLGPEHMGYLSDANNVRLNMAIVPVVNLLK